MVTVFKIVLAAGAGCSPRFPGRILATFALISFCTCLPAILAKDVSAFASEPASPVFDDRRLTNPVGLAYFAGKIYVANAGADSVTIYSAKARGKVAAIDGISGLNTALDDPRAVAVGSSGKIYVANTDRETEKGGSITVYAPNSSGSMEPIVLIEGDKTRINTPVGVAVDSAGNIFVANEGPRDGHGYVTVYSPGDTGNAAPVNTLGGPSTELDKPAGVAVDPAGNVYVTNFQNVPGFSSKLSVKIYRPGSSGDVAPVASVDGSPVIADASGAIAPGPKGDLFVAGLSSELRSDTSIGFVYRDPRYLNIGYDTFALKSVISGSRTGLSELSGLVVDPAGHIYAADPQANSISIFAAGATGDVAPITKIRNPAEPSQLPSDALIRKLPWTSENLKILRALTKAAVFRFFQAQTGSEDASAYSSFDFGWYPAGGENYELVINSQSGPDISFTNIFCKNASGKVTSQDFGIVAYGGTEKWYRGPQFADLDHDGKAELIDFAAIGSSSRGLDPGKWIPDPSWPQVYRLQDGRYLEDSRAFAPFYEKRILPQLAEAIAEARKQVLEVAAEKGKPPSATMPNPPPPDDSYWFQPARYLAAITMCRDKILRVLGRDPNAGLEQAREWMKSSDPFIVNDARIVFEDIAGHRKEADEAMSATRLATERWPDRQARWGWYSPGQPNQPAKKSTP